MEILKVTSENYKEEVLDSDIPVLVDFYANWCGPCKMMLPVIEEIANEKADNVKVVKVDVDQSQDLAIEYGIMTIPTMIVIKEGEVKNTLIGLKEKSEILEILN